MKFKLLFIALLALGIKNMYAQPTPGGKSWADSFQANGLCWCDTTFDHDLGNINKVSFVINGKKRNIRDVCDELKKHPKVRNYRQGDPIYNDIQCGNGPANTAWDETACPGRVDKGKGGCFEIGPRWDIAWLKSRARFDGGSDPNLPAPNVPQSAYRNHSIPGKIQVEDFDNGGQNVAYKDADDDNNGNQGRTNEAVDLEKTTDAGGGLNIGWVADTEWLEYTIANVKAGTYSLKFRVAAYNGNTKSVAAKLGNKNLGSVAVPNTGGWQNWQDVVINNVVLTGGKQLLRLDIAGGSFNINWIEFSTNTTTTPTTPPTPTQNGAIIAGKIEAEDFDSQSGIQKENTTDNGGGQNIGYIQNGDNASYKVNVQESGSYQVAIRVASATSGGKITLRMDGTQVGQATVSGTSGWQNWQTINTTVSLSKGAQILKLDFTGGAGYLFNVNRLDFSKGGTMTTPITLPVKGNGNYVIRARGVKGEERIALKINNVTIETFDLTTAWANYSASSNSTGTVQLVYINDVPGRDLEVDHLEINGKRYQAEDQAKNTAVWQNKTCGGSFSQFMHCGGYIEFSTVGAKSAALEGASTLKLHPNPTEGLLHLTFERSIQKGSFIIYDNLGRKVATSEVLNSISQSIDVSSFNKGVYYLEFLDAEFKKTVRSFVKK